MRWEGDTTLCLCLKVSRGKMKGISYLGIGKSSVDDGEIKTFN